MTVPPSFMEDNGRARGEEARGAKEIPGSGASSCQAVKLCVSRQEQRQLAGPLEWGRGVVGAKSEAGALGGS